MSRGCFLFMVLLALNLEIQVAVHGWLLGVLLNMVLSIRACPEYTINYFLLFQVILHLDLFLANVIDLFEVDRASFISTVLTQPISILII